MAIKQKQDFRLDEIEHILEELQRPVSSDEQRRRDALFAAIDRQREALRIIHKVVKDWIRPERGE
jgi:hypothetical protein